LQIWKNPGQNRQRPESKEKDFGGDSESATVLVGPGNGINKCWEKKKKKRVVGSSAEGRKIGN